MEPAGNLALGSYSRAMGPKPGFSESRRERISKDWRHEKEEARKIKMDGYREK